MTLKKLLSLLPAKAIVLGMKYIGLGAKQTLEISYSHNGVISYQQIKLEGGHK